MFLRIAASSNKKNWLFAGSERAGRQAAGIQTLLGAARLNGLDPDAELKGTAGQTAVLAEQPH